MKNIDLGGFDLAPKFAERGVVFGQHLQNPRHRVHGVERRLESRKDETALGITDETDLAALLARGKRKRLIADAADAYDDLVDTKRFWR